MAPRTRKNNGLVYRAPLNKPIPEDVLVELNVRHNKSCMFCGHKEISETLYGQLYQLRDVVVHYFCILLSSRAVQNGDDKDGIWGFLLKDIKAELNRGSRIPCHYCNQPGATIACCGLKCRKVFHLPCGLKHGSMHQYFQKFQSFCQQHRITQTIDLKDLQQSSPVQCSICKEDVVPTPLPTSLWAPCCKRNAWFHRKCIQDLAISAGYFFKCPLCNNVDIFKGRMLTLGIYVPSRDASWETVPNAYAELLERHSTCNADSCLCPHQAKRNFQLEEGSWEIIICNTCGSRGTHRLCSSLKICDEEWICESCNVIAGPKRRRIETSNDASSTSSSISTRSGATNRNSITSSILRRSGMTYGNSTTSSISIPVETTNENETTSSISRREEMINDNSTTHESQPSNRNIRLRRTSARDAPRTRGSTRLNNNIEIGQNESIGNIASTSRVEIETIVISSDDDDSDHDSDIQCITYLDQSSAATKHGLPIITSTASLSSLNVNNRFPQMISSNSLREQNGHRGHNVHTEIYVIRDSIDLTNTDDESDTEST